MSIVDNKKAFHDYFIEERFEAGMVLEGWEVKSIRAGRVQLKEAYVIVRKGEVYLFGAHISALPTASTHVSPDPVRTRKLLLKAEEIKKLIGSKDVPQVICNDPTSINALPGKAKDIAGNYCNHSQKIVEDSGLTVERFNKITVEIQNNNNLKKQLYNTLLYLQKASPSKTSK